MKTDQSPRRASGVYVGATYLSLGIGALGFVLGLWNATMVLNEKGYYFTLLCFGLFAAIALQKCVRDQAEGIRSTGTYIGLCYIAVALSLLLLVIGLWNATLSLSEKGYYAMSFTLALFAAVTVQKSVRDNSAHGTPDTGNDEDDTLVG